jgi:hypothetical protein
MKACLVASLLIYTLILSSVLFSSTVQTGLILLGLSFSSPVKQLDATWDLRASTNVRAIPWPKNYAASTVWKTRYTRFMLVLPSGFGEIYSNVWASAWRTDDHIDEIALEFSAEPLKDAQAHAGKLKHDLGLEHNSSEKNYLQAWADQASHEFINYDPVLNCSQTVPQNPDWPPVGVNLKPYGYNNLWSVTLGVRLPRD